MKVTLHESNDGTLHKTAKLCAARNIELRVLAAANAATFIMTNFEQTDENANGEILKFLPETELSKFIAANADILRKLLNEALVAKRPRKPRTTEPVKRPRKAVAAAVSPATAEY